MHICLLPMGVGGGFIFYNFSSIHLPSFSRVGQEMGQKHLYSLKGEGGLVEGQWGLKGYGGGWVHTNTPNPQYS